MAVTNRAKGQFKPPSWAQRGKLRLAHVPGGPSEAAAMILSGTWDNAGNNPGNLMQAARYGPALVEELVAKGCNAVCLTWSLGFSDEGDKVQWEAVRNLLPLLRRKKIKAVAAVSLSYCFAEEMGKRFPNVADWQQRDSFGNVITFGGPGDKGHYPGPLLMDTRQAPWREYLRQKVSRALEAGFDGLIFTGLMCDPTGDVEFLNEARKLAREARGESASEFLFCCDAGATWPLNEIVNLKFHHCAAQPGYTADGELTTNLAGLKFASEDGGRDKPFVAGVPFRDDAAPPSTEEGMKETLAAAEIMAAGGMFCELAAPAAYVNFGVEHRRFYEGGDPVNTVAVLSGNWDALDAGPGEREQELVTFLARHNVQFDVMPVRNHERFDLRKYKVIYAGHAHFIPDALVAALRSYAEASGGTVIASPVTGAFETPGHLRLAARPFALDGPPGRREKPVGEGRFIEYAPPRQMAEVDLPELAELGSTLLDDIRACAGPPPIEVQAPDGLIALLWGKGTKRWVHVLNYRLEPCDATIALPGCGGRKIAAYSPDAQQPALSVLETGQARAAFALSGIETYAVVEVV
ncbi:MAG: hypothetical protein NTW87_19045 [Planctomycetota bacterium]|nr:hypothetical protein [Planctomycetota bacterium]